MCKHVAAVLYGIGARFDTRPELLFRLRAVDEMELIVHAGKATPLAKQGPAAGKVLGGEDLSAMFGLDMEAESADAGTVKGKKRVEKVAAPKAKGKASKKAASTARRKRE